MPYTDHYEKYLNEIPEDIEKCKETGDRIVFGYTSDLDVLLTYNEDEFNKLVDTYVKGDIYRDGDENITDLLTIWQMVWVARRISPTTKLWNICWSILNISFPLAEPEHRELPQWLL